MRFFMTDFRKIATQPLVWVSAPNIHGKVESGTIYITQLGLLRTDEEVVKVLNEKGINTLCLGIPPSKPVFLLSCDGNIKFVQERQEAPIHSYDIGSNIATLFRSIGNGNYMLFGYPDMLYMLTEVLGIDDYPSSVTPKFTSLLGYQVEERARCSKVDITDLYVSDYKLHCNGFIRGKPINQVLDSYTKPTQSLLQRVSPFFIKSGVYNFSYDFNYLGDLINLSDLSSKDKERLQEYTSMLNLFNPELSDGVTIKTVSDTNTNTTLELLTTWHNIIEDLMRNSSLSLANRISISTLGNPDLTGLYKGICQIINYNNEEAN